MNLDQLMRDIETKMTDKFKEDINSLKKEDGSISVNKFKRCLVLYFLTRAQLTDERTIAKLHSSVDNTSLCGPEYNFFHDFLDLDENPNTFIASAKRLYHNTQSLNYCQLGPGIFNRIEYGSTLVLV